MDFRGHRVRNPQSSNQSFLPPLRILTNALFFEDHFIKHFWLLGNWQLRLLTRPAIDPAMNA